MKKRLSISLLIASLVFTGCATRRMPDGHQEQMKDLMAEFYRNLEIAQWLAWYDDIAWISSDAVMEQDAGRISQLGAEWFVYEKDGIPHAVYGKYEPETDIYNTVFHFRINGSDDIELLDTPVEASLGLKYARALHQSATRLIERIPDIPVLMNHYVRTRESGNIEVWYLPAGQSDGCLVYGVEVCFTYSGQSGNLVAEHILNRGFLGLYPKDLPEGEPLYIGDGSYDVPSIGEIFFVTAYASRLDKPDVVYIQSKNYLSTRMVWDGIARWIHGEWHEDE